jgi:hypothetical protein
MNNELILQCPLSKNRIELRYDGEKVLCEYTNIDYEYYKSYFLLLKMGIDESIQKGYKYFSQLVTIEDYNNCLKDDDRWIITKTDNLLNTYIIECNLTNALECVCRGFGIK